MGSLLAGAALPVLVLAAGALWPALVRRLLQPSRERYWDDAWARFDHADDQASR